MSGNKQREGRGSDDKPVQRPGRSGKEKASPIGRALRSVYDDTLRESVPDDFLSLLRKLD